MGDKCHISIEGWLGHRRQQTGCQYFSWAHARCRPTHGQAKIQMGDFSHMHQDIVFQMPPAWGQSVSVLCQEKAHFHHARRISFWRSHLGNLLHHGMHPPGCGSHHCRTNSRRIQEASWSAFLSLGWSWTCVPTLQSATLSMENELAVSINGVINNKTLQRLIRGSQHQPDLANAPKGASKPLAVPLPPPPKPKKKKKKVVPMEPIKEIVVNPDRRIDESDTNLPSPRHSPPLSLEPREPTPLPPSQTLPSSLITSLNLQPLHKNPFSPCP